MAELYDSSDEISTQRMMKLLDERRAYMDDLAARRQAGEVEREEWCICSDEYWERALDDPACRHDEIRLRQTQIDTLTDEVEQLRPSSVDELLAVYDVPLVREIAMVLWGHHEVAARPSHRPDAVRELFCDANASMVLAAAIYERVVEPLLARGTVSSFRLTDQPDTAPRWRIVRPGNADLLVIATYRLGGNLKCLYLTAPDPRFGPGPQVQTLDFDFCAARYGYTIEEIA